MECNFENDRPIYIQLAEQLKKEIAIGKYKNGEKLPSVRELALSLQVNPNTIQKALNELEEESIIYTKRTSGKFISEDSKKLDLWRKKVVSEKISNLLLEIKRLGMTNEDVIEILKKEGKNENNSRV